MPVSLSVFQGCSLKTQPMTFLLPAVVTNDTLDTTSTITVKCSPNTNFTVDLDDGLYPKGIKRQMRDPVAGFVEYQVYRDTPRSKVWRKGNFDNVAGNSGTGTPFDIVLYGRVANASKIKAGGYKDTLTVTLNF